jgi:hypothetical protein
MHLHQTVIRRKNNINGDFYESDVKIKVDPDVADTITQV